MMKSAALMAVRFFVAFEVASVVANLLWHEISFGFGEIGRELAQATLFAAPAAVVAAALWWRLNSQKSSG